MKISSSTKLSIIDQGLVSGVNVLLGLLLVRMGSLELFGNYVLLYMVVTLASSLQQALILSPMSSIAPKMAGESKHTYYRSTRIMQGYFVLGITCLDFLLYLLGPLFGIEAPLSLPFAVAAFLMQEYLRRWFFVEGKVKQALLIDVIAYPGLILGVILLAYLGVVSVANIFWLIAISFSIAALSSYRLTASGFNSDFAPNSFKLHCRRHWQQAKWLASASLLQFFSGNFFILAAAPLLGASAVGAIRMVQSLMGAFNVLFLALENTVPIRAAAALADGGMSAMTTYLKRSSGKMLLAFLPMLLGFVIMGEWILDLCYGEEASAAFSLIIPFCLLYLFILPGYPLRYALRAIERTQAFLWAYAFSSAFALLAATPMLKAWGILAVPVGLICSQIIMQIIYGLSFYINTKQHENHTPYTR